MKTGRLVGVLVIAGIGIGAFLGYVLPEFGFGVGTGTGTGEGTGPISTAPNSSSPAMVGDSAGTASTKPQAPPASEPAQPLESTTDAAPVTTIYVLIDGRDYLLRRGPEGTAAFKPASLDAVIEAAQAATGDENGIRVRISQKSSSRETAERALREQLEGAGIPGDAVRWRDEPADSPSAGAP